MKQSELRDAIIPKLHAFAGVPIIEADQAAPKPKGPHAAYKFTTPYGKDVGMYNETSYSDADGFHIQQSETFKFTMSLTAYAKDNDVSFDLAQSLRDWFQLHGVEELQAAGIAVVDLTNVDNRDALVVDEYERRNGFDMIGRAGRAIARLSEFIESADVQQTE